MRGKPRKIQRFNLPRGAVRCASQCSRMTFDRAGMPVTQFLP
jgi:hypothetical protein